MMRSFLNFLCLCPFSSYTDERSVVVNHDIQGPVNNRNARQTEITERRCTECRSKRGREGPERTCRESNQVPGSRRSENRNGSSSFRSGNQTESSSHRRSQNQIESSGRSENRIESSGDRRSENPIGSSSRQRNINESQNGNNGGKKDGGGDGSRRDVDMTQGLAGAGHRGEVGYHAQGIPYNNFQHQYHQYYYPQPDPYYGAPTAPPEEEYDVQPFGCFG